MRLSPIPLALIAALGFVLARISAVSADPEMAQEGQQFEPGPDSDSWANKYGTAPEANSWKNKYGNAPDANSWKDKYSIDPDAPVGVLQLLPRPHAPERLVERVGDPV